VAWNQFAIIFGMLVIYFVNFGISKTGSGDAWLNTIGWRYMFLSGTIPAVLFLLLLLCLCLKPRATSCSREMKRRARGAGQTGHTGRRRKGASPKSAPRSASITPASCFPSACFGHSHRHPLSVFQQFVGINVVLYYATDIFKGMGLTTNASLFQTIIVGAVNLAFTVVAIVTVDHFGRKPLQIVGALVMAVSMISLGTDFWLGGKGMVALVAMLVYTAGFAVSWGPVTWVLLSEIFPNQIRGKAMAVAVAAQWIANYLVSWSFPILDKNPYLVAALQARLRLLDLRRDGHSGRALHGLDSCLKPRAARSSRWASARRPETLAAHLRCRSHFHSPRRLALRPYAAWAAHHPPHRSVGATVSSSGPAAPPRLRNAPACSCPPRSASLAAESPRHVRRPPPQPLPQSRSRPAPRPSLSSALPSRAPTPNRPRATQATEPPATHRAKHRSSLFAWDLLARGASDRCNYLRTDSACRVFPATTLRHTSPRCRVPHPSPFFWRRVGKHEPHSSRRLILGPLHSDSFRIARLPPPRCSNQ
jgi:hypothetical protein